MNIKKIDQKYLHDILRYYPNIGSGRKNYSLHHKRVLKNILLSQMYAKKQNSKQKNL